MMLNLTPSSNNGESEWDTKLLILAPGCDSSPGLLCWFASNVYIQWKWTASVNFTKNSCHYKFKVNLVRETYQAQKLRRSTPWDRLGFQPQFNRYFPFYYRISFFTYNAFVIMLISLQGMLQDDFQGTSGSQKAVNHEWHLDMLFCTQVCGMWGGVQVPRRILRSLRHSIYSPGAEIPCALKNSWKCQETPVKWMVQTTYTPGGQKKQRAMGMSGRGSESILFKTPQSNPRSLTYLRYYRHGIGIILLVVLHMK